MKLGETTGGARLKGVEPYASMLPREPFWFLLADDPGAGKSIMGRECGQRPRTAGLLIKELIAHGDLHRCLVGYPGHLAEQWQDEFYGCSETE